MSHYLNEYVPFFRSWVEEIGNEGRVTDKAFFQFGRFRKKQGRAIRVKSTSGPNPTRHPVKTIEGDEEKNKKWYKVVQ